MDTTNSFLNSNINSLEEADQDHLLTLISKLEKDKADLQQNV